MSEHRVCMTKRILSLWVDGADTIQIAKAIGWQEACVYNLLDYARRQSRAQALAAAGRHITKRRKNRVPIEKEADYRFIRDGKNFSAIETAKILELKWE